MGTTTSSASASSSPSSSSSSPSSLIAKMSSGSQQGYIRRAHHAGSWYSNNPTELDTILSQYLQDAAANSSINHSPPLRGIICPHAGYSYSGPTAAYSYWHLQQALTTCNNNNNNNNNNNKIEHILVFHPSHHVYLDGCAISGASQLETPLGSLLVDEELRQEILQLNKTSKTATTKQQNVQFTIMTQGVDEHEHSGEMQYPYIAKAIQESNKSNTTNNNNTVIKVLPIMCGNLSVAKEEAYGRLLAPIVARSNVLCVISTDFCHWGKRFQYQPTPNSSNSSSNSNSTSVLEIFEYIRQLDHQGMNLIELQQPGAFAKYLKETKNTICGRHAIGVWLNAVVANTTTATATTNNNSNGSGNGENLEIQFVKYAQSSEVRSMRDSSVSYASATARKIV